MLSLDRDEIERDADGGNGCAQDDRIQHSLKRQTVQVKAQYEYAGEYEICDKRPPVTLDVLKKSSMIQSSIK